MSKTHWKQKVTAVRLRELLTYNPETGLFCWNLNRRCVKAGAQAGTTNNGGYIAIKIDGRLYTGHRLAWLWTYGRFPLMEIDHINMQRTDNRISNLREVSSSQNKMNTKAQSNNNTGDKGVSFCPERKKYVAQICVNGHKKHLGRFSDAEGARSAYRRAAALLHGEFRNIGTRS